MKRRLCRREAKRTVTLTCAEGTLHGAKPYFIFHAPQVRFIEKSHSLYANGFFLGRGSRIRTHDKRFWRPLLYQLNYTPIFNLNGKWWALRDSNPGPTGYEPVALTN